MPRKSSSRQRKIAHEAEGDVALTLWIRVLRRSLPRGVPPPHPHRHVDLAFANERELHSLYETADFDTAVNALRNDARAAVVTRSEKGCLVITREETDATSPARSSGSWMRPAPATCSAAGFSSARRVAPITARRPGSERSPRRRSSGTSARGRDVAQGVRPMPALTSDRRPKGVLHSCPRHSQPPGRVRWNSCRARVIDRRLICVASVEEVSNELAIGSPAARFPVGTRYVVEGRGGARGRL